MQILPNRMILLSPRMLADISGLLLAAFATLLLRGALSPALLPPQDLSALAGGGLALLGYTLYRHRRRTLPCHLELVRVLPRLGACFGAVALGMTLSSIPWSAGTFLLYLGLSLPWALASAWLELRHAQPKLLLASHGCWKPLARAPGNARLEVLEKPAPELPKDSCMVADLESLPAHWGLLSRQGMPVYDVFSAYEKLNGRICLAQPARIPTASFHISSLYRWKSLLDFLLSFLLLSAFLPLMVIIGIAIRLDTSGPILFSQERIGRMGHRFNMLKFRTMDATTSRSDFKRSTDSRDRRITRIGRLLRKFRLDELPQLFNVLRGEMSLIGPRPAVSFVHDRQSCLIPLYSYRLTVRPGITGWAQVHQGYVSDENLAESQKKVEYDLYYIKHFSLWLDIAIFLMTLAVVLGGRGAR